MCCDYTNLLTKTEKNKTQSVQKQIKSNKKISNFKL